MEDEWLVYLFKKDSVEFPSKLLKRHLPDTVQSMIKDQKAMFTYPVSHHLHVHIFHEEYLRSMFNVFTILFCNIRSLGSEENMVSRSAFLPRILNRVQTSYLWTKSCYVRLICFTYYVSDALITTVVYLKLAL